MVRILPRRDIAEEIGGSFGKGLGGGTADQYERGTLAQGIERIAQQKELSPLQQYAGVLRLPGGKEIAPQVQPFIESDRALRASQDLYPKGEKKAEDFKTPEEYLTKNIPPKYDRESENYLLPMSEPKLQQRAQEIVGKTGGLFSKAYAQAKQEDDTRVAGEHAFEKRNDIAENEFTKYLETEIQKSGSKAFKDIIGEMQNEYKTKVQNLVGKGMSPRQAGLQEAKKLLDFAKARDKISTQGMKGLYNLSASEVRRSSQDLRKIYGDLDKLELFRNDLISKGGMSKEYADSIAFPIENNPKEVAHLKSIGIKHKIGSTEKLFSDMAKDIGLNDSINALSLAIYDRGLDPNKFRDKVSEEWRKGKLSLTQRQERELQDQIKRYNPTLRDLYYTSFFGKTHKL